MATQLNGQVRLSVERCRSVMSCVTCSKEGVACKATRADSTIRRIRVEAKTIGSRQLLGDSLRQVCRELTKWGAVILSVAAIGVVRL